MWEDIWSINLRFRRPCGKRRHVCPFSWSLDWETNHQSVLNITHWTGLSGARVFMENRGNRYGKTTSFLPLYGTRPWGSARCLCHWKLGFSTFVCKHSSQGNCTFIMSFKSHKHSLRYAELEMQILARQLRKQAWGDERVHLTWYH